jgi:hypothetical protein
VSKFKIDWFDAIRLSCFGVMGAAGTTGLFAAALGRPGLAAINAILVLANATLICVIRNR